MADTSLHALPLGLPVAPAPFRDWVGWPSHQLLQTSCPIQTQEGSPCLQPLRAVVLLFPPYPTSSHRPAFSLSQSSFHQQPCPCPLHHSCVRLELSSHCSIPSGFMPRALESGDLVVPSLCHFLHIWPWVSCLISSNCRFLLCTTEFTSCLQVRIK